MSRFGIEDDSERGCPPDDGAADLERDAWESDVADDFRAAFADAGVLQPPVELARRTKLVPLTLAEQRLLYDTWARASKLTSTGGHGNGQPEASKAARLRKVSELADKLRAEQGIVVRESDGMWCRQVAA